MLKEFKGLGRGKGFETTASISVLGDDIYSPMVFDRLAELCSMFMSKGGMKIRDGCILGQALKWKEDVERESDASIKWQDIFSGGVIL